MKSSIFIAEVMRLMRENPERANEISANAARHLRRMASQPSQARQLPMLLALADEFSAVGVPPAPRGHRTVSDFDEIADEMREAYEGGGGDDMEHEARRRDAHEANGDSGSSAGPSHMSIIPETIEGARTGNTIVVKYQPSQAEIALGIKESDTVLLWQGDKKEAQSITIDVGLIKGEVQVAGSVGSNRPYGLIDYGTDGYKNNVKFDVGCGTRFTVAGNYVSVMLGMDPPRVGLTPGQMTLGASLGFFAAPSIAPVTCTQYVDQIGANATVGRILRPAKAVAILPPQGYNGATLGVPNDFNVTLIFSDWSGNLLYWLTFDIGTVVCPIPLTNDVAEIAVKNNTNHVGHIYFPFQLAM